MAPDLQKRAREIFNAALDRNPGDQAAFLREACAGDEALLNEVESLLVSQQEAQTVIESRTEAIAPGSVAATQSLAGREVGPYHVLSLVGVGGMGEIYLAKDTRLDRRVALKLLPGKYTGDENSLRRFVREAKAASALNHPNIITIHDIGQIDDLQFIATEFIEGHNLRQRMRSARMKIGEAVDIAIQVTSALAAAHDAGIAHRDIKPENIMVRPDGLVKVLDFGIAKLTERQAGLMGGGTGDISGISTLPGIVIGTPRYMSPEQARGQKIDERTDIFSLGTVIYEMIAGRLPFEGETATDVIAALLGNDPPPLSTYLPGVPQWLEQIVAKALTKGCEQRYQTAKELQTDLKRLREGLNYQARLDQHVAYALQNTHNENKTIPPQQNYNTVVDVKPERDYRTVADTPPGGPPLIKEETEEIKPESVAPLNSTARSVTARARRATMRLRIVGGALLAVALVGLIFFFRPFGKTPGTEAGAGLHSIAVLPFKSLSGSNTDEYLGVGLTDSLITRLNAIKQVSVKPTSAVLKYGRADQDPVAAGRDLGVDAVLEGTVRKSGERIRVTVQLVSVKTGGQLWADTFDEKASDVFTVEDRVSTRVTSTLRLKLTEEERRQLAKRATGSTEAYDMYLKGRYYWNKRTPDTLMKSTEFFDQAIALDPSFALAYAGLADSYVLLGSRIYGVLPPGETMPKAKRAAIKAIELDETLAEAHTSLGLVKLRYGWDWAGAEQSFKRAIELNPQYAPAYQWLSDYFMAMGRNDEAIAEIKLAREADPSSVIINSVTSVPYYYARQYDRAIEECRKSLERDQDSYISHLIMALSYAEKKMYEEALAELQKGAPGLGSTVEASTAYLYGVSGRRAEALKVIEKFKQTSKQTYIAPSQIALIYSGLKDAEHTIEWLERAYNDKVTAMIYIKVDPKYDWIRSDPRFISLMRRMKLIT
jgi:eukaryotic-like serine/threonine-protein kinase